MILCSFLLCMTRVLFIPILTYSMCVIGFAWLYFGYHGFDLVFEWLLQWADITVTYTNIFRGNSTLPYSLMLWELHLWSRYLKGTHSNFNRLKGSGDVAASVRKSIKGHLCHVSPDFLSSGCNLFGAVILWVFVLCKMGVSNSGYVCYSALLFTYGGCAHALCIMFFGEQDTWISLKGSGSMHCKSFLLKKLRPCLPPWVWVPHSLR